MSRGQLPLVSPHDPLNSSNTVDPSRLANRLNLVLCNHNRRLALLNHLAFDEWRNRRLPNELNNKSLDRPSRKLPKLVRLNLSDQKMWIPSRKPLNNSWPRKFS
jgi:hypothetical protein